MENLDKLSISDLNWIVEKSTKEINNLERLISYSSISELLLPRI